MPRKPKLDKKAITVILDGTPVAVTLYPPAGARRSWFAYWSGLSGSKSTGQSDFSKAVVVAENMLCRARAGGGSVSRAIVLDTMLTDEELEKIQREHFDGVSDPLDKSRAAKSLTVCLEALAAFKSITGLAQLAAATADECAAFQRKAKTLPKNWRQKYPKGKKPEEVSLLSPNTILKWSRSLQAAFERANRNAPQKKCVRGVVPETKLLSANPWNQFNWIEGREKPIRQFEHTEIESFLHYLETTWIDVTVASLVAKVFLWSAARQQEVVALRWSSLRRIGDEVHFEIVGKAGVERWFRLPSAIYEEMESLRTGSPYVFAAYNEQLRRFHEKSPRPDNARRVGSEYKPQCLGDWFADRIDDWSATLASGHAHTHIFRKTSLQYVRAGEDINRRVASDARVTTSVMMTSYVKETDEEMRQASNRTFARILASLPGRLAQRCGYTKPSEVEEKIREAVEAKNWPLVHELTGRLMRRRMPAS
jgi:integrase